MASSSAIFSRINIKGVCSCLTYSCNGTLRPKFSPVTYLNGLYKTSKTVADTTESAEKKPEPIKMSFSIVDLNSSKRPVIIMHGLLGSRNNWHSLAKAVSKRTNRKVITVDARNHGSSPWSPHHQYSLLADDTQLLLDDLDLESAVMVGHSMGGRAMMSLALTQPESVERLVVADVSPIAVSPNFYKIKSYITAMRSMPLPSGVKLSQARLMADSHLQQVVPEVGIRQFLVTNLVDSANGSISWKPNLKVLEESLEHIASFPSYSSVYQGSTLFIGGANSDYIKKDDHNDIRKLFPAAQFQYIEGAGHWVHSEKPQEFIDLLCNFLFEDDT